MPTRGEVGAPALPQYAREGKALGLKKRDQFVCKVRVRYPCRSSGSVDGDT